MDKNRRGSHEDLNGVVVTAAKRIRERMDIFRREITVYQRVMRDPRCPHVAKLCLGGAIAYALSPIDLIPDFIPIIGHLDDLVVVPLLIWIAIRMTPRSLVSEVRDQLNRERCDTESA